MTWTWRGGGWPSGHRDNSEYAKHLILQEPHMYIFKGLNSIQGRGHTILQKFCELVLLLCFNILPAIVLDTFQSFHLATTKKTKISNLRFSKISYFANIINSKKQWRSSALWICVFLNIYFILRKTVLVFSCEQDVFFTNCSLTMLFQLYVKKLSRVFKAVVPNLWWQQKISTRTDNLFYWGQKLKKWKE